WSADIHVGYRGDFRCEPVSVQPAGVLVAVLPLPRRIHSGSYVQPQGPGPARPYSARAGSDTGTERGPARAADDQPAVRRRGNGDPRADRLRPAAGRRSEEHTSELQSRENLVCRLLLEKKTDQ